MILRHIFLRRPEQLDTDELTRSTIEELRRRIVEEGEDFAAIARQYSADPGSRPLGGDLGSAPRRTFVPSIDDAVWTLPIGEVSEPIQSEFGWHLVEVIARDSTEAHARHILLTGAGVREALADTIAMVSGVLEAGEEFASVAARFSDAPSAIDGEAYYALLPRGYSPNSGIPADWYQALEEIDSGGWTGPLEVPEGIHILQKLDVDAESVNLVLQHDFSTARLYIQNLQQQEAVAEWLQELRDRTYIEIKPSR
jgi:parvulin-like peptidyl-prolyl isomerase